MLRLNNVSAGYHKVATLKDLSFEIQKGEIFTLMGLNGSGKSTLLRTLLGLLKPIRGEIVCQSKISLLDSHTSIIFPMRVRELLEISERTHGVREITKDALHAVGLDGYEERNLLELSSGEVKRALIAHTLATHSDIIMIDEPFAHLDWRHQNELAQSLKAWNKKFHTTFVLAIHEFEWILKLAHRVAALGNSQILALGKPEDVFRLQLVCETFAFQTRIDENPIDGSRRLTLGAPHS